MAGEIFTQGVTLGGEISAAPHNDAWDELEDWINPRLADGVAGELIICDADGNPRPTPLSGDATIDQAGVITIPANAMSLASSEDTQSAAISASGVLTGISITPGAGTYLAIGTASFSPGVAAVTGILSLRVNGAIVISGPQSKGNSGDSGALVAQGIVTPIAGQAVDLHGSLSSTGQIDNGRLTLVRIA